MNKIKDLLKKSPVATVIAGLLIAGTVSAALVNYLSNTIVSENVAIESPIEITSDGLWEMMIPFGGNSDITMITVKNRAEVITEGVLEITVEEWNGSTWNTFVQPGMEIAFSADIDYWNDRNDEGYNPTNLSWRDWLSANPEWMDWLVSDVANAETTYDTTEISPFTGNRDGVLAIFSVEGDEDGNYYDATTGARMVWDSGKWTTPILDLDAGQVSDIAIWIVSASDINPATYRFSVTVRP